MKRSAQQVFPLLSGSSAWDKSVFLLSLILDHTDMYSRCLHPFPQHQTVLKVLLRMRAHISHSPYCTHNSPDKLIFCLFPYRSSPTAAFHPFYLHNHRTQQTQVLSAPDSLFHSLPFRFHPPFHPIFPQPSANTPTPTHMYALSDCLPEAVRRDLLRIRRYMPLHYNVR